MTLINIRTSRPRAFIMSGLFLVFRGLAAILRPNSPLIA
jgi:hypothetical protein